MKTIGIALLFALCCLAGVRLGAKKAAPLKMIRAMRAGLQSFSDRTASGATLADAAEPADDAFRERLSVYLESLSQGSAQADAAGRASAAFGASDAVRSGAELFFCGLSDAPRAELQRRIEAFGAVLARAEVDAENESKQARVLRSAGFLVGTGLAVLLL